MSATPTPDPTPDAAVPSPAAGVAQPTVAPIGTSTALSWMQTRQRIAANYCRVVAVIDDDIDCTMPEADADAETTSNRLVVSPRFWQLRQDLQNRKILCHLHHYPKLNLSATDDASEIEIEKAVSVATAANVIVLDWNLGMEKGSEHAEAILEKMVKSGGLRFVIINSNDHPTDICGRLEQINFMVPFMKEQSGTGAAAPLRVKLGDQVFILIREKRPAVKPDEDASMLVDEVFKWLEGVFPDHLHWAGLELASRISLVLPKVLGTLPKSTDVPLFHQWMFNDDGETNNQVVSLLLDEIGLLLDLHPLSPLDDELIKDRVTEQMKIFAAGKFFEKPAAKEVFGTGFAEVKKNFDLVTNPRPGAAPKQPSALTQLILGFEKTWNEICLQQERVKPDNELRAHFPGPEDSKKHLRAAIHLKHAFAIPSPPFEALAAWYESAFSDLGKPKRLFPGAVFKKNAANTETNDPEWLLCVAPGCDCRWGTQDAFAFLPGRKIDAATRGKELMSTCISAVSEGPVTIAWKHKNVMLRPKGQGEDLVHGYILAGAIRPMHAVRICHRTWTHQARVAVDVPEYIRAERGEEDTV